MELKPAAAFPPSPRDGDMFVRTDIYNCLFVYWHGQWYVSEEWLLRTLAAQKQALMSESADS